MNKTREKSDPRYWVYGFLTFVGILVGIFGLAAVSHWIEKAVSQATYDAARFDVRNSDPYAFCFDLHGGRGDLGGKL